MSETPTLATKFTYPALATLFISYCLSDAGQELLYQPRGRHGQEHVLHRLPVQAHLYDDDPAAPDTRPYAYESGFAYDTDAAGKRWRIINDLVGVWLIDAHSELTAAWKQVCADGLTREEIQTLTAVPVTEQELEDIAKQWGDTRFRLAAMTQWSHAAQERYRGLSN